MPTAPGMSRAAEAAAPCGTYFSLGTFSFWPIESVLVLALGLRASSAPSVMLYLAAIVDMLSPCLTR